LSAKTTKKIIQRLIEDEMCVSKPKEFQIGDFFGSFTPFRSSK